MPETINQPFYMASEQGQGKEGGSRREGGECCGVLRSLQGGVAAGDKRTGLHFTF